MIKYEKKVSYNKGVIIYFLLDIFYYKPYILPLFWSIFAILIAILFLKQMKDNLNPRKRFVISKISPIFIVGVFASYIVVYGLINSFIFEGLNTFTSSKDTFKLAYEGNDLVVRYAPLPILKEIKNEKGVILDNTEMDKSIKEFHSISFIRCHFNGENYSPSSCLQYLKSLNQTQLDSLKFDNNLPDLPKDNS